jgi:cholesterol oxidase
MGEVEEHYDWVIVGSGFGGSVSALRLSEKGYRVLVIEKGRRFRAEDFPKTNWNLPRFLWLPALNFRGIQGLAFLRHITFLYGVGVGGGSLVYANTLPVPKPEFFHIGTWKGLADWEVELQPHYETALRMLGTATNPYLHNADRVIGEIAKDMGREDHYEATNVAVFFGEPEKTVPDPYFGGKGPDRAGCNECGGCMIGCRYNAKNTLDKNYLYLAEQLGCTILPDTEVHTVRPLPGGGYRLEARTSEGWFRRVPRVFTADRVVLSGGVLGTISLLLEMQQDPDGLPDLSSRLGEYIRTNSESLICMVASKRDQDLDTGVAIGSILHTDEHSHVEPVRYSRGSGAWRTLLLPHAPGETWLRRIGRMFSDFVAHPLKTLRALTVWDLGRYSNWLLYMRTLEGTLRFERARGLARFLAPLRSLLSVGTEAPKASLPEATDIGMRFGEKTNSVPLSAFTETLFNIPTTAHILGGACIGETAEDGVIGLDQQVHNYPGLYVCDGAAVSANPGVNPSLTITAMTERAMSLVAAKEVDKADIVEAEEVPKPA